MNRPTRDTNDESDRTERGAVEPSNADQLSDSTVRVLERALSPVRRWARGRLPPYARSGADTEDVVQDAFLKTLRSIKRFQYRTVGGLQAYLRRAVVNRIRDLIRGSKRRGTAMEVDSETRDWMPSPLEAAIMRQQLDRFLEALHKLRPADRLVIVWRIELGYTTDEIAARLGKSKAAAGMTVTRAMSRLAKELRLESEPPR